jgi:hypothetical protein
MSYRRTISLKWLRGKHWIQRYCVAVRYGFRLHRELQAARLRLTRTLGAEWVESRLPGLRHGRLAGSAWGLFSIAADPQIDRAHRLRTARWQDCLRKLRARQTVAYALTEPASQRVYRAALGRCLSELAGEPMTVPEWVGSNQSGLAAAILRWLESVGIDHDPLVLATPVASSALDPLGATGQSRTETQTLPVVARDELWEAAVRQQYEFAHEVSLRELHAAYLRCYLAHIALAEALAVTSEAVAA